MSCQRSSGSFARARPTATSSHAGSPGQTALSVGAGLDRWADTTAIGSDPSNGSRPVTSSNSSDAERIHVRSGVDDAAGELLGRRVGHGADELLRPGEARLVAALPYGGDAEVDDLVDPLAAA